MTSEQISFQWRIHTVRVVDLKEGICQSGNPSESLGSLIDNVRPVDFNTSSTSELPQSSNISHYRTFEKKKGSRRD